MGISTRQKVAAAVRFLATGCSFDDLDDRYRMGETTLRETVKRFCINIQSIYTSHHLRPPNKEDLEKLLKVSEGQGWPGMLGSLDCSHYRWKNCPVAWAGQFEGHKDGPTIILEAIADSSGRIWHAYFGMPGSHNDINVLESSPLFYDAMTGILFIVITIL